MICDMWKSNGPFLGLSLTSLTQVLSLKNSSKSTVENRILPVHPSSSHGFAMSYTSLHCFCKTRPCTSTPKRPVTQRSDATAPWWRPGVRRWWRAPGPSGRPRARRLPPGKVEGSRYLIKRGCAKQVVGVYEYINEYM